MPRVFMVLLFQHLKMKLQQQVALLVMMFLLEEC